MSSVPRFSRFAQQRVLLVGSGPVAEPTLWRLVEADVRVRWFSQDIDVAEEIWLTGRPHQIEISFREPTHLDFEEAAAAIATIGGPLADRIADQARASGCPVSFIGRPELSTLTLDADSHPGPGRDGKARRLRRSLPQRLRTWISRRLSNEACSATLARAELR